MNLQRLKIAENQFLELYPEGFQDPEMLQIGKKHRVTKMTQNVHEMFAPENFENTKQITIDMGKIAARSSVVSVFEKVKFKDFMNTLAEDEHLFVANALKELLHGKQENGFNDLVDFLQPIKLAKWTLLTVIPAYYYPNKEVFIKPTTVKNIIEIFELEGLQYKATPSYDFYKKYKKVLFEMKKQTPKSLRPNNLAFTGFLMMAIDL